MTGFQAGYFDGLSSKKHSVLVLVDDLNNHIAIEHEDGSREYWPMAEIVAGHTGNHTELKHRSLPGKTLHVSEDGFRKELRKVLDAKNYAGWYQKLIYAGTGLHIFLAVSILGLIAAAYWWVLPAVAEKAVDILPESYDKSMGSSFYESFIKYETVDEPKTQLMRQFADELDFKSERDYRFTVVRSKEINAFALPDGSIIIYTGILEKMDNYQQLVALLSHETSHVNNRHSMKLLCRNLAGYLFLSVVLSDVNGIMAVIADNANTLRSLSYSRNFEQEADLDGLKMMVANKTDPVGMIGLFEVLKNAHTTSVPGFISTHPLTDDRIDYINREISTAAFSGEKNEKLDEIFQLLN
jgi:beta-barrel assembly-enhancing protease